MPLTSDEILCELSTGIASIYAGEQKISIYFYMELYTHVFNLLSQGRHENDALRLYNKLENHIKEHTGNLKQQLFGQHGERLLIRYTQIWNNYKLNSSILNGIFSYLNHQIWEAIKDGEIKSCVFVVYNLAIHTWEKVIFDEIQQNLRTAAFALIEQDRKGGMIESRLIKRVVESCIEMGINHDHLWMMPTTANTKNVPTQYVGSSEAKYQLYQEYFVKPFLMETHNFYTKESTTFASESLPEYMKRMEIRLCGERYLCQRCLDDSTLESLLKTCGNALIAQRIEQFQNEFGLLLSQHQTEHLHRMYNILRFNGVLDKFKNIFEQHVIREGLAAIKQIAENALNDPKKYIEKIMEMYTIYNELVVDAFQSDNGFAESMDKAFIHFVNQNEIIHLSNSASKSPKMLALYCDQLLRKSAKIVENQQLDGCLENAIIVFKYIEDKDMFQTFFHKMLCKRLITDSSASEEAEHSMIAKLRQICGFEYTRKMERLLMDMTLSRENIEEFKKEKPKTMKNNAIDFSAIVLMSNVWPYGQPIQFKIPSQLMDCIEEFKIYYNEKYASRKLNWALQMSRGELFSTPNTFSKNYTFTCNTQQISLLMMFNTKECYKIEDLVNQLGIGSEQLTLIVNSLINVGLLKIIGGVRQEEAGELTDDGTLELNLEFKNKKHKVDLIRAITTANNEREQQKESEDMQKSINEDRKFAIQASIVRIMKMRKTLRHQQLMAEVLNQLTGRFQPNIPMVKKCIDMLIEKQYLKRSENEWDTFEYLT